MHGCEEGGTGARGTRKRRGRREHSYIVNVRGAAATPTRICCVDRRRQRIVELSDGQ